MTVRYCLTSTTAADYTASSTDLTCIYCGGTTNSTIGAGSNSPSLAALATTTVGYASPRGFPLSDTWETSGTESVVLAFSTTNADIDVRVRILRINQTGTVQDTGSYTSYQTTTGTPLTFNPTKPTWGTESTQDRLVLELEYQNTSDHGGNKSATLSHQAGTYWDTNVTLAPNANGYVHKWLLTNNTHSSVATGTNNYDQDDTGESGAAALGQLTTLGESWVFATVSGKPNNDAFDDGTDSYPVIIETSNSGITALGIKARMVSYNSSGTQLEAGSYGATVSLGQARDANTIVGLSMPNKTWSVSESCSNLFGVEIVLDTGGIPALDGRVHNGTVQIGEFYAPISVDVGSCTGGSPRRIFLIS